MEVAPAVHVPDYCHLFECVLEDWFGKVLGPLELVGATILEEEGWVEESRVLAQA